MKDEHKNISMMMSLVLRHQPEVIGAQLDESGWMNMEELISGMNLKGFSVDKTIIQRVVKQNDKQRFKISEDGLKIRASQGHSLMVNPDLLEKEPPTVLYHGTVNRFLSLIKKKGLQKMKRQHVHLSADKETAVNVDNRRGEAIVLEIKARKMFEDGNTFYLSANGVWLTDEIKPEYIAKLNEYI